MQASPDCHSNALHCCSVGPILTVKIGQILFCNSFYVLSTVSTNKCVNQETDEHQLTRGYIKIINSFHIGHKTDGFFWSQETVPGLEPNTKEESLSYPNSSRSCLQNV